MDVTDPVLNDFEIIYDYSTITPDEADIKVHTVTYYVEFKDYASLVTTITSTFTFEIQLAPIVDPVVQTVDELDSEAVTVSSSDTITSFVEPITSGF